MAGISITGISNPLPQGTFLCKADASNTLHCKAIHTIGIVPGTGSGTGTGTGTGSGTGGQKFNSDPLGLYWEPKPNGSGGGKTTKDLIKEAGEHQEELGNDLSSSTTTGCIPPSWVYGAGVRVSKISVVPQSDHASVAKRIHLSQLTVYNHDSSRDPGHENQAVFGTVTVEGCSGQACGPAVDYRFKNGANALQKEKHPEAAKYGNPGNHGVRQSWKFENTTQTKLGATQQAIVISYSSPVLVHHVLVRVWHGSGAEGIDYKLQVELEGGKVIDMPFGGKATCEGFRGEIAAKEYFRFNISSLA
jgi:hypothetical protein